MGQVKFMASLMLIALFSYSIVIFASDFADDNNAAVSISNDEVVYDSLSGINQTVEGFTQDLNGTTVTLSSSDFSAGADASAAASAVKIGDGDYSDLAKDSIESGFRSIFGGDPRFSFFLYLLLAFLGTTAVLYFWSAVKGGNVE